MALVLWGFNVWKFGGSGILDTPLVFPKTGKSKGGAWEVSAKKPPKKVLAQHGTERGRKEIALGCSSWPPVLK